MFSISVHRNISINSKWWFHFPVVYWVQDKTCRRCDFIIIIESTCAVCTELVRFLYCEILPRVSYIKCPNIKAHDAQESLFWIHTLFSCIAVFTLFVSVCFEKMAGSRQEVYVKCPTAVLVSVGGAWQEKWADELKAQQGTVLYHISFSKHLSYACHVFCCDNYWMFF